MQSRLPITPALLVLALLICATSCAGALGARSDASSTEAAADRETSLCPARLPANPLSSRPGATVALVPAGATSLLLCSYHGLNPLSQSGKLARARTITGASELRTLTHEFDTLPKASKLVFCPMDDG